MTLMTRRYYTPTEADRSLPLVRAIVTDVTTVAKDLRRHGLELHRKNLTDAQRDAIEERVHELELRFRALQRELDELGIELKDPFTGLIDFWCLRGEEEVYLCWKLGEERVAHWHTLEGGFRSRQRLEPGA
jgi:hypothetical protein